MMCLQITDLTMLDIFCSFVEGTKPVSCVEIEHNNFLNESTEVQNARLYRCVFLDRDRLYYCNLGSNFDY